MCGSRGTLDWSRTLRNTGRPRKRATLTSNFFSRRGGFGEKRACNESLGTSASPLATRQRRRCGACATSQQPGHSTMPTPERSVHSLSPLDGSASWNAPRALWERTARRMSMRGGGIAGAAYLLRLSLSPTDEDWQKGEEHGRWWLWDALRRPLGRIRMHGQGRATES